MTKPLEYYTKVIYDKVMWEVEYTDEFGKWWDTLGEDAQNAVNASVDFLAEKGPTLSFPDSSGVSNSRHSHMRELRIQHRDRPIRIFYAFDPRRCAILLIGGDKTGNNRFYDEYIPIADRLYDEYSGGVKEGGFYMTGHRPFSELTKDFSPQRQAAVEAETKRLLAEMTLQELREALHLQQEELGELLGIKQAAVSRMERRSDIHLSNLRKAIEAMGGELVIIARFPNVDVRLNNIPMEQKQSSLVMENGL